MVQQTDRKYRLSGSTIPGRNTALPAVIVVVLLVAGAPLVAGVSGASSTTSDATQTKVDIVFVFDSSASTNEDRYHMAQEIDTLANRIQEEDLDARYGLVTYSETAKIAQPLTSDFDSFEKAMHFPESGNEEHASDAILTATAMNSRSDAETVVVVVTDEDDDSSNATRDDALSALSGHRFVAVSPSSPSESSCAVHSPPCDNRSDNELKTMADDVGGDWIDQSRNAETIVDGIADIVAPTTDTESDTGTEDDTGTEEQSSSRPEFTTTNRSANRTVAEVGDPVRFTKTVENVGTDDGTYEAYLSHEGTILAEQTATIAEGESRTITFVHRFDQPGEYGILITHESIETVTVTEPDNVSVDVTSRTNGTGVTATISDAWANGNVSIPLSDVGLLPEDVATIENMVVSIGDVNVTPVHDVAFDLAVLVSETPPNGTESVPEHISQVRYLTVGSSLGADLAGMQFEYVASANKTTLYRYNPANSTWDPLDRVTANETGTLLRTDSSNATLYAVGVRQPAMSVTNVDLDDASIDAGGTARAMVTVSNEGAAAGTFNASLRLNGSVVAAEQLTVPSEANRTVAFAVTSDRPGQYTIDVPGGPSTTLQVDAVPTTTTVQPTTATTTQPATATATQPATATTTQPATATTTQPATATATQPATATATQPATATTTQPATATETPTASARTGPASGSGFGIAFAALAAFAAVAVLARWRE